MADKCMSEVLELARTNELNRRRRRTQLRSTVDRPDAERREYRRLVQSGVDPHLDDAFKAMVASRTKSK